MKTNFSIPKSHMVWFVATFASLILLNMLPGLLRAKSDDFQTFKKADIEVFRVDDLGGVHTSSRGIKNTIGLFVVHELFQAITGASNTIYVGSDAKVATSTIFGSFNGLISTITRGATTYVETNAALRQPDYPRTIFLQVFGASGTMVVKGTDTFNRPRQETFIFRGSVPINGNVAFAGISSFTISVDTVDVALSSVTFNVGFATGIGIQCRIDYASDVVKSLENSIARSTTSASVKTIQGFNAIENTISISSIIFAASRDLDIWVLTRKSIYADPLPPFAVTKSTT